MTLQRLFVCVLLSMFAVPLLASEARCRVADSFSGDMNSGICGWIEKKPSYTTPTAPYNMLLCPADYNGNPPANPAPTPYGQCVANTTVSSFPPDGPGGYSYYEWDHSAYAPSSLYYIYAWSDADHYGSSTVPVYWLETESADCYQPAGTPCGSARVYVYPQPAPLPVSAVYPADGQQNAPQSFTLKWTTGKDAARNGYTAAYDVYGHGMGASDILEASNAPCNPDASGNCTLAVTNVKSNSYIFWHVVAKFPSDFVYGAYLTTTSPQFTFTTLTVPSVPISFGTNDWRHYLTANVCGGAALLATATTQGSCESFKVVNLTPHSDGDIYAGDTVAIQSSSSSYYATALSGGGSNMLVTSSAIGDPEKFTINKVSTPWSTPGTRIMNQDRFSLTSSGGYYVNAYNGGGGSVDACNHSDGQGGSGACTSNTTFNPTNQTFIYYVH